MEAIITTFLRRELLEKVLPSYQAFSTIVVDQDKTSNPIGDLYVKAPFDCGLSKARNLGVSHVKGDYVLISADSIEFIGGTLDRIISFMDKYKADVVGLPLKDRIPWNADLELDRLKGFVMDTPKRNPIVFERYEFIPCDIVCNFFIGRTEMLKKVKWNEKYKLAEHEDFFWRLKKAGGRVFALNSNSFGQYYSYKKGEYLRYRGRWGSFVKIVEKDYNISKYWTYTSDLTNFFTKWRQENNDRKTNRK